MRLILGCGRCQCVGPPMTVGAKRIQLADKQRWTRWMAEHGQHAPLVLLPEGYDPERPLRSWAPRQVHGPPAPMRRSDGTWQPAPRYAQQVTCPVCSEGARTTWHTADRGMPFVFCKACGYVWGPAADAAEARGRLRGDVRPGLHELMEIGQATTP